MNVSEQTQAMLLLTVWLTRPVQNEPKPLTPTEWGRLAQWLKNHDLTPEALLRVDDLEQRLQGWQDASITLERMVYLLGRAGILGLVLEKWQRAGLWVMTRAEGDYPIRLKNRLKLTAPPLFFGCGQRSLLNQGGIAVVGSRHASPDDLAFATRVGGDIARQGCAVVSGGARGVDEAAMRGALEQKNGTAIGILPDSLLRAATSAKYREALMAGNLALISPFNPEAGFDVGNAMARNRYIYSLADAAVVVAVDKDKGGTWQGAVENLKRGWVPTWIKRHPDNASGNAALVGEGGHWLPDETPTVTILMAPDQMPIAVQPKAGESAPVPKKPADEAVPSVVTSPASHPPDEEISLYDFFLLKLKAETQLTPRTADSLREILEIGNTQLKDWLTRALAEGKVEKKKVKRQDHYQMTSPSLDLS